MVRTVDDVQFWNGVAGKYAKSTIKDMAGYERTVERARHFLKSTDRVLEIGCGTGTTALKLAPSVAHIEASDVSSEMIATAQQKAIDQSCSNVRFSVGAAAAVTEAKSVYDAVLAFNLLHLLADRKSTLDAIHRQLKSGGLFISKTPCLSEMNPLIRFAVPVMRFVGKAPFVAFLSASAIEAEIADAGFTIIERGRHGSGRKDARIFLVARK
jgi:ubiquinone/menaquinone biosynthesis C-methylase UbiE